MTHDREAEEIDLEERDDAACLRVVAGDARNLAADAELQAHGAPPITIAEIGQRPYSPLAEAAPHRSGVQREAPLATREAAEWRSAPRCPRSVSSEKYVVLRRMPPTTKLFVGSLPTPSAEARASGAA